MYLLSSVQTQNNHSLQQNPPHPIPSNPIKPPPPKILQTNPPPPYLPLKSTTSTPANTFPFPFPLPFAPPSNPRASTSHGSKYFHAPSKLSRSAIRFLRFGFGFGFGFLDVEVGGGKGGLHGGELGGEFDGLERRKVEGEGREDGEEGGGEAVVVGVPV